MTVMTTTIDDNGSDSDDVADDDNSNHCTATATATATAAAVGDDDEDVDNRFGSNENPKESTFLFKIIVFFFVFKGLPI